MTLLHHMRAEAREGGAERLVFHPSHARAGRRQRGRGGRAAPVGGTIESIDRPLPEGEPPDAAPAEMAVDAGEHLIRHMLQFEREAAFDADQQRRGRRRRLGGLAAWARRPLQLDGPRVGGEPLADDLVPVEDEIGFGEALARQRGVDRLADEVGERLRPGTFAGWRGRHGAAD